MSITAAAERDAILRELRSDLALAGVETKPSSLQAINRVLEHIGHAELVVDALLMYPRPNWLWNLVGYDLMPPTTTPRRT